jgi:hypothetical protein
VYVISQAENCRGEHNPQLTHIAVLREIVQTTVATFAIESNSITQTGVGIKKLSK